MYQPWMDGHTTFRYPLFIKAKHIRNGLATYRVQWLSLHPTPESWEPGNKLPPQLVHNYEQLLSNQARPPGPPPRLPLTAAQLE